MRNKLFVLLSIIISFFALFWTSHSASDRSGYLYPYVCNDQDCYETDYDTLRVNRDDYFMANIEETYSETWMFSILQNIILWEISDYYGNKTFTIQDVYRVNPDFHWPYYEEVEVTREEEDPSWSWTITVTDTEYVLVEENESFFVEDREFTIEEIFNYDTEIIIVDSIRDSWSQDCVYSPDYWTTWDYYCYYPKTYRDSWVYSNGFEYLMLNFRDVINDLHTGLPRWERKNRVSDYIPAVYDDTIKQDWSTWRYYYSMKNICTADGSVDWVEYCDETRTWWRYIDSDVPLRYITWDVKPSSDFRAENFKVYDWFRVSSYSVKANESVYLEDFWFQDYLDTSWEETAYQYKIYYRYSWENIPDINNDEANVSEETIYIDTDFNIRSDTLTQEVIDQIFDIDVISWRLKQFRISVNEWFTPTKIWDIYLYLYAKNLNTQEVMDLTKVNSVPIKVLPNDNIQWWRWYAEMPIFSIPVNNSDWYNHETSFAVSIRLEDPYGNPHYDTIDGYDITFSDWTDPEVVMAAASSQYYYRQLNWVKSDPVDPYLINIKIKIPEPGNTYNFTWFDITAKHKQDDSTYADPVIISTIKWVIPRQVLDSNGRPVKIYIKEQSNVDFAVPRCTSWSITFTAACNFDRWGSWCWTTRWPTMNVWWTTIRRTITFTSQSQNGAQWTLVTTDRAYNTIWYNYGMNHIDESAPNISFRKWSAALWNSSYSYKANSDSLFIDMDESTAWWSSCVSKINYQILLNWAPYRSWTLWWTNNSYLNDTVELPWIFETKWVKNIKVTATDEYGNSRVKDLQITVNPSDVDVLQSFVTPLSTWDKYPDWVQSYNYRLTLKDQYWNTINWKTISSINQTCDWVTSWCSTIRSNMYDYLINWNFDAWSDSLIEKWYSWVSSNTNWEIPFQISSNAPWEFTNRFKVEINWWNDDYSPNSTLNTYTILSRSWNETNGFNKLFIWDITASDDDWATWVALPEFGTNMKYKVSIIPTTWFNTSSNLVNFRNYIDVVDYDNTSLQSLSDTIDWLSTKEAIFDATINTSDDATDFWTPGIQIENWWETALFIWYYIWSEWIIAPVSPNESYNSFDALSIINSSDDVFIWAKVVWLLQWDWKSNFAWLQEDNFSDISMVDVRWDIRKNAYSQISQMRHNSIVWGVKYVDWNQLTNWIYVMESNPTYETIILKDGDLFINRDINISWNKLWIIVLKDNYDVNTDYLSWNGWNVYVSPDVSEINAVIYADGWFISVNDSWIPYSVDNTQRSSELSNQLLLKGTLFTRNTIWGAFLVWGDYKLPWGSSLPDTTQNFNKAMVYDLNYTRRWIKNCIVNWSWVCKYRDWAFVIEYNPNVQVNPPKVFVK